ncbi:fructose-1,6-bisphosphatase-2 [Elsinoe australis]|uniref:Fructose-1,6-bisphosphatase-2 n=1 Tax=Elsinoe australis TaxID=40998 RepID=A0A4U7AU08_9PEZI|nr:fructose-1,6-bisphosphatase-2 [Elsinoe australis]
MSEVVFPQLTAHLGSLIAGDDRRSLTQEVIPALISAIFQIAEKLRASQHVSQVGTANAFGDDQLNVDVIAEQIIRRDIEGVSSITTASSEEDPVEKPAREGRTDQCGKETYTLAFDPLDGSSIIAPNWSVGTIIGIWDGDSALRSSPEKHLIASILGIYGPRTTAIVALRLPQLPSPACFELGLGADATGKTTCEIIRPSIKLTLQPYKTRYFAPANLRAAAEDAAYLELVTRFITSKYTLRYSGGLVPDVAHALTKGHGLYVSPVTEKSKAKLRKLYELTPIALIIESAGGLALDAGSGKRILDQEINDCDERAGIICGNKDEVEDVAKAFGLSR